MDQEPIDATYITAMVKGGSNGFALKGADATAGPLKSLYDGARPAHYQPMKKQGSIILGIVSRHDIAGIWVAFSPSGSHSSQDGSDMVADRAATTATPRKGRSTRA